MKWDKHLRGKKAELRGDQNEITPETERTSSQNLGLEGEQRTRKPGSQSKSGGRHNNGRGGGK
jgi:hypothetical protein